MMNKSVRMVGVCAALMVIAGLLSIGCSKQDQPSPTDQKVGQEIRQKKGD
jgi:hypothetical protein